MTGNQQFKAMGLFDKEEKLKAELKTAQEQLERHENTIAAHAQECEGLRNEIAEKDQVIAENAAKLTQLEADLVTAKASVTKLTADLDELGEKAKKELAAEKAKTEAAEKSATEKANAMLAQAGHPQLEVEEQTAKEVKEKVMAEYRKLEGGPARKAFRKKHKEYFPGE